MSTKARRHALFVDNRTAYGCGKKDSFTDQVGENPEIDSR
jgi:hypothetical protein